MAKDGRDVQVCRTQALLVFETELLDGQYLREVPQSRSEHAFLLVKASQVVERYSQESAKL